MPSSHVHRETVSTQWNGRLPRAQRPQNETFHVGTLTLELESSEQRQQLPAVEATQSVVFCYGTPGQLRHLPCYFTLHNLFQPHWSFRSSKANPRTFWSHLPLYAPTWHVEGWLLLTLILRLHVKFSGVHPPYFQLSFPQTLKPIYSTKFLYCMYFT